MKIISVPKGTGTYADSLRAIGTASLLEDTTRVQTTIRDMGSHFEIECVRDVPAEQWKTPEPGFHYIWRKSKEKERPQGMLVLDYEEQQVRARANRKVGGSRQGINRAVEEQGNAVSENVSREYGPSTILESMRKGWNSDRVVYQWITSHPDKALKWVKCELVPAENNKCEESPEVSNSQFYNPVAGKGVHVTKTSYKSPSSINTQIVAPFAEWMKFRGAYYAMLPYRNDDDFKLFVIEPVEIGPKALSVLRERLLDLRLWGGIRLDIEATLRLAEELINHSDVVQDAGISLRGLRPSQVVSGLRQAYFKSMGTAAALMNDAFLPLPSWFRIDNRDDANSFIGIIREHIGYYEDRQRKQGCLGVLDESHSGDVPILQEYRKWIATGEHGDFLEFLSRFAVKVMERRGRDEWVKEFSSENLTILFERGYGMKEIVENSGFLNIANAIRNSTVSSFENLKSGWRGSGFETQFGMAQEWRQKMKGGKQVFIPALSEFIQKHNWEAVHRLKKGSPPIAQDDLNNVMQLIEQWGVELVGMLLLAYGYARAPKLETDNQAILNQGGK